MSEEFEPYIRLGIVAIPTATSNFITDEGANHNEVLAGILNMIKEVMEQTTDSLMVAARIVCERQGIRFELMDDLLQRELAKAMIINVPTTGSAMLELDGDNKVMGVSSGAEAISTRLSGRRTDN